MNVQEAREKYQQQKGMLAARGVILPNVQMYLPDEWKVDHRLGMDAQPVMTTDPNSAIPAMLTTTIDPDVIRILFSPLEFADALGERRLGNWLDETRMFPVIESTGEVSAYDDFSNNGRSGINMNWPNFQSYLFQIFEYYGERELERASLANINFVGEIGTSSALLLNTYQNLTYAFGVQNLQNYGIINNPYLSAMLTPATKAAGGTGWFNAQGGPNATANEVYNDIVALWSKIIAQTNGVIKRSDKAMLMMSPGSELALEFANSFGVFVSDLLKKGFPNMTIKTAPQYGLQSATNPQGFSVGGNVLQLIVEKAQGQQVVYCAFNEKMRAHKIVAEPSAWKQKKTSGSWGTILRIPAACAQMIGV